MVESLDALGHALISTDRQDSRVDTSTFCASQVDDFNQTVCCQCWRETAYCKERRREAHAQEWKADNVVRILSHTIERLKSFRSWTTEDLDSTLMIDTSGSGSGSRFDGSTSENFKTDSTFANKLNKIDALLKKTKQVVSNVTVRSFLVYLNLLQRKVMCLIGVRLTGVVSREDLPTKRKDGCPL